jgi:hypothetical protein
MLDTRVVEGNRAFIAFPWYFAGGEDRWSFAGHSPPVYILCCRDTDRAAEIYYDHDAVV